MTVDPDDNLVDSGCWNENVNQTTCCTINLQVALVDSKLTKRNFDLIEELLSFGTSIGSACDHRRVEVSDDDLGM